jgi:Phospholipase_D-nuclease N-terminal
MVFAADYPFMDVFWSMLIFFVFVAWLFVLVVLLTDIFRRHDISGLAKAAWTVFLIVLPILGPLTYLVMNHHELAVRVWSDTEGTREQANYLTGTTNGGPSAEIEKAQQLLDSGAITQMEFEAIKGKVIA